MFRFVKIGEERGDCTTPYSIVFDKAYTVGEFVQTVLSNPKEWGRIGIKNELSPFFGDPRCEYRHGKLVTFLPDDVLDKKVVSATAEGGWGNMCYQLTIEDKSVNGR